MESLVHLARGFEVALAGSNLLYCLIGVLWGTIVGVLPGLGPLAGLTLLLPLTFSLEPASAVIMLAGIFYGAMYGGSTTSILVNIPGEAASVMTCIDGHQMARQGRAGPALVIAAIGSWVGGTVSVLGLMLFAPPLAEVMLGIGPSEELLLMVLALLIMSLVSSGPASKTMAMILLGLMLGTVGSDPFTGYPRMTYGIAQLTDGVSFAAMAIGLFGVSEILFNLEDIAEIRPTRPTFLSLIPRWRDLKVCMAPIARGSGIGFLFGVVPGVSHIVSTFVSYAVEKRLSHEPDTFGTGRIEGVAGPETANNATTGSSMIPLLVLGIPSIPATALMLSALLIHGIQPGPQLIQDHPDIFWGLIASMYVGNLLLLILNLPFVTVFVNLLRIRYAYLAPGILMVSVAGVYSVNGSTFDVWLMVVFGIAGYLLRRSGFDVAPLLLAVVLGDRIELSFRRALIISNGDYSVFLHSAFSQVLLGSVLFLGGLFVIAWRLGFRRRSVPSAGP